MNRKHAGVKSPRPYDATGRQARAEQQWRPTLAVARRLFLDGAYVATTVESIAELAGVSAATIYKSYGGKAGLVRALCEDALTGQGPVPAEERSNALRGGDASSIIAGWARLAAEEVLPRGAPLMRVLEVAAHHDADARSLLEEFDGRRLTRMRDNARALSATGELR